MHALDEAREARCLLPVDARFAFPSLSGVVSDLDLCQRIDQLQHEPEQCQ